MEPRFKNVFDLFLKFSRGLINFNKFQIYALNNNKLVLRIVSIIFSFPYKENLKYFIYLEVPISLCSTSSQQWKHILEKIKKKSNQWGAYWVNPTRRLVLIKSILSNLTWEWLGIWLGNLCTILTLWIVTQYFVNLENLHHPFWVQNMPNIIKWRIIHFIYIWKTIHIFCVYTWWPAYMHENFNTLRKHKHSILKEIPSITSQSQNIKLGPRIEILGWPEICRSLQKNPKLMKSICVTTLSLKCILQNSI
jgi:hypothetical protein